MGRFAVLNDNAFRPTQITERRRDSLNLNGSLMLIENKIETRFIELGRKLDALFTGKHKDAGAMVSMERFWRVVVPVAAAIAGALISRYLPQ